LELSMARATASKIKGGKTSASPPFERVALLLQGGGALGA
jgi:predicted acylesterase/phospholipase RssA